MKGSTDMYQDNKWATSMEVPWRCLMNVRKEPSIDSTMKYSGLVCEAVFIC
jgi:hypothetical protein